MKLQMAGLTHKGRVREQNEDSLYCDIRDRLVIVCDGMGGHAGGHIASELGVQVVSHSLRQLRPGDWLDEEKVIEAVKQAIFGANDHILSRAQVDPTLNDMGTTICACAFMKDKVVTCNIGDSRIYRIANDQIEQISQDHSLVAERIRAGSLDPNSFEVSLLGNIVTRALGMEQVTVDITVEDLVAGDTFLLCSDGLSDMIEDHEMLLVLQQNPDLKTATIKMVDLANERGGIDNITVAIAKVS
jgi:protein phosphatase